MAGEELILKEIENLKEMLSHVESPRLSQKRAKKFLQVGDDKFKRLVKSGRVRVYVDDFGDYYYMKSDLIDYLKSNVIGGIVIHL